MTTIRRIANELTAGRLLLVGLGLPLLCAVHPIVAALAGAALLAVWGIRGGRGWEPNVYGENAYQILGVGRDAELPAIRAAFRELERQYHPDAVPDDQKAAATAVFIRLNQAFELLSDREKRFQYDGLLDDLDGRVPPFAEAYARIKDEDKHPAYAEYDALHEPAPAGPEPMPEPTPEAPPPVGEAVEVEMPESVREALGLPPAGGPPG